MTLHLDIDTDTAAFTDRREQEAADLLRQIANQIEEGFTSNPALIDSNGERVGTWECDLPEEPQPLTGEELVVAYIAWVDQTWATDPKRIADGYADLMIDVRDDRTQRAATISDTDMVHPSNWVFLTDFITHLKSAGQYSTETAAELAPIPQAA